MKIDEEMNSQSPIFEEISQVERTVDVETLREPTRKERTHNLLHVKLGASYILTTLVCPCKGSKQ